VELADRVLPDLLKAGAMVAEASESNPTLGEAIRVLQQWDRHTDGDSRGAVLFQLFADRFLSGNVADRLGSAYDPDRPLETGLGLSNPAAALEALGAAAEECRTRYGALDVKWGDVYRFASGTADVPGNGGPGGLGLFRTIAFSRREGNRFYAASGETIVCAIEFARTQRAQCLLGYGNATQPGSPHLEDQLPLMVQKKLLPIQREKKDIESNLERREGF
jgi:acyl-homoserine-lactone acylase